MIEQLKKILEEGITTALREQAEHTNKSFVMSGKGEAFREVLLVIEKIEELNRESTDIQTSSEDVDGSGE